MSEATNETPCQPTDTPETLFEPIFMIIEMIVGLPGNMLALWIFCFRIKFWKPHTLLLFNLVVADVLLVISVPFRIATSLQGDFWVFGQAWCRVNLFMLAVNRSASIAFMTAVALDRYFKVVHPHHCISHMTLTHAGWLAGLTWTVVIALRIPLLTTNLLKQNETANISQCRSFNSYKEIPLAIQVHYVAFVAETLLPWILLLFCSARITCSLRKLRIGSQKNNIQRAIRAVVVISFVFTICFIPSVITGLGAMYIKRVHRGSCTSYKLMIKCFMMSLALTYLNSTLNPVIYCFSSSMFRDALKSAICRASFVKNIRPAKNKDTNL
ncbi:hydroxycarboxylic acid receptor 2-like [Lates calcarifer]|uniref:Hydroxycarboxylic acid receptor 1-3 n=1 Tax=Lates calcarifer TaxID=8187 RepID=A0A4W6BM16_LATCA|nr:hydroxycarboxylic acid receptor 2-like [Lates calcarifer]